MIGLLRFFDVGSIEQDVKPATIIEINNSAFLTKPFVL
jgi:hypothetical protein